MSAELELLPSSMIGALASAPYSYPEVGATRHDQLPAGYRVLRRQVVLPGGRERYERVADRLLGWGVQLGAGLRMQVSHRRVVESAVLIATLRFGPFPVRTRCRIVYLIEEPDRVGFAYGTLPGHPEVGEERFLVELLDHDQIRFGLTAFSRNASLLARLGGPISHRVQTAVNQRYLKAVQQW
ncbi:MAG TPA: DUF1990 domain-containing protein [Microlunatus sp.]